MVDSASARVLLVDDDAGLCRVLARTIARPAWTIAWATDLAAAEVELCAQPPSAVILDLVLGHGIRGTALLPAIRAHAPRARVAIVTGHYDVDEAIAADDLVDCYLTKPVAPLAMVALIERLLRKRSWREGVRELCARLELSDRQEELLCLLVGGETIKGAALQMGCKPSSARTYLQRILERTGAATRAELVAMVLDRLGPAR